MATTVPSTTAEQPAPPRAAFDAAAVRADFPILAQTDAAGRPFAFLDSASSSQKPTVVIDTLADHYRTCNANIHRGVYRLSETATDRFEGARARIARFIGADSARECVFVRNATEAINLVAAAWGRCNVGAGDLLVATMLDHHANIVPWQLLAEATGARLALVGVTPDGRLDLDHLDRLLAQGPKLVAFPHVSNVLGTITPAAEIVRRARAAGAVVLVDGAQSVPHLPTDVRALGADFLAFSGHKMLGPTGVGVLYGRLPLLEAMPPALGGGGMIRTVGLERSTWAAVPAKFEAGTPAIAEAVALGAAVDYLEALGMDRVRAHERELTAYALARLATVPDLRLHGPADPAVQGGVVAFALGDRDPRDVAAFLDAEHVAVRAGYHCGQPLLRALGAGPVVRASFYVYTAEADVDRLVAALRRARRALAARPAVADDAPPSCGAAA